MMRGPVGRNRYLQVHPTRQCNLRCLHCYSESGPDQRAALDIELLRSVVSDAADEGYTVLGISGGEPLLYKPLRQLLVAGRQAGMFTTVTTNGMLLRGRRLEMLIDAVDILAISLDGVPQAHNRMRDSHVAFEMTAGNLEGLRQTGIPFGFIFTLTQHNVNELDWVANFAIEQGASLLQIHPLEEAGRAQRTLSGAAPDETEMSYAFLEAMRIQATVGDRLNVQLDLVDRDLLRAHPERVYADEESDPARSHGLAELIAPLVVEADGTVVPLQYGFPRRFALGNVKDESLNVLAENWCANQYTAFRELCRQTYSSASRPATLPFLNWYEMVGRQAGLPGHDEGEMLGEQTAVW